MTAALFAGIVFGFSAGLAPGPMLALVLAQSLRYGAREGVRVAFAPLVTDVPIVLLCLAAFVRLARLDAVLGAISLAGGAYVVYLAVESLRTRPLAQAVGDLAPRSLRKGILINFLNPHPYVFWFTVGVPFLLKARASGPAAPVLFLVGFYAMLVGSKATLALLAGRSREWLSGQAYVWGMRGLGAILLVFAGILVHDGLAFWGVFPAD